MSYANMAAQITRPSASHYHALLFVGVCNRQRYVLSLRRWTRLLRDMYGYLPENIRILVGTYADPAWPAMEPGTVVTNNATMNDLDNALAAYGIGGAHALGAQDSLFIFTFNHGGYDGQHSFLSCDSFGNQYDADAFAARIVNIHCRQIVLLAAQCRAGGFVHPFINALAAGTRGAVIAGSTELQDTWEAVFDKLCASALNGRMVQNALDDNIDLGITGEGIGIDLVPGYSTDRITWGPNGVISTLDVFNWVNDHYVNLIYPNPAYAAIIETPQYDQSPWMVEGVPVNIRLGEPELVMQDTPTDSGVEPCPDPTWWYSPDVYADNTDHFPTAGTHEYVPTYNNRFLIRTANRGTAPTDGVWRQIEVRGLASAGGVITPPQIVQASETVGGVTATARLRPGRAHGEYKHIYIGGNYGHGCVSAAAWTPLNPLGHPLWNVPSENAQVQCNLDPSAISGSNEAGGDNANAGKILRTIPVVAPKGGTFTLRLLQPEIKPPITVRVKPEQLVLKPGQQGEFTLDIRVRPGTPDGFKAELPVILQRGRKPVGGVTLEFTTATAWAIVLVKRRLEDMPEEVEIKLGQPGEPRILKATTVDGRAKFGPLNPGFYLVGVTGYPFSRALAHIVAGHDNVIRLSLVAGPHWSRLEAGETEFEKAPLEPVK